MTGHKSGVIARLCEDQPYVLNIHYMAHKLALCTSQAAESVTFLKKYKEANLFYYCKHSFLRTATLSKIEKVLNDKKLKIKGGSLSKMVCILQRIRSHIPYLGFIGYFL